MRAASVILLLTLVSGCEIWDPRPAMRDFLWGLGDQSAPDPYAEIRKKEYPTWPAPIRKAVENRQVQVGMTRNQALLALRIAEEDIQKQVVETADGKTETWTVWKVPNGWSFVRMETKRQSAVPFSQMTTISLRNGVVAQIEFHAETKGLQPVTPRSLRPIKPKL